MQPEAGLISHSDRGSRYCSSEYQKLLDRFHMKPSMSRKGNCYDNAPMESFWGTMKNELIYHERYATREQAIRDKISRSILKYSTIGNGVRKDLDIYLLFPTSSNSMQGGRRHEYYWCPLLTSEVNALLHHAL